MRMMEALAADADLEQLMCMAASCGFISTVRQKTAQGTDAMGKSRGVLSTKIHASVDAQGNPVRVLLTPGQASEYGQSERLIEVSPSRPYWPTRVMTQTLL